MVTLALLLALQQTDNPQIEFGRRELNTALAQSGLESRSPDVTIRVSGKGGPETYEISFNGPKVQIAAGDLNGAMYGALEMAERVKLMGARAFGGKKIVGKPFVRDRGWNQFLTLPFDVKTGQTDYDPAALTDPNRWYFANDRFWTSLFDQMARARLNWLDLHGTWDVSVTSAPNLYAYFIQSDLFPAVGVSPEIKAKNLKQLNRIIDMAHARGIRVSLMCYEARFTTPHNPNPYPQGTEQDIFNYTREVVEKTIRQMPKLDMLGFRIGESGRGGEFFNSYLEGIASSGKNIPLITRSWLTRKAKVVPLAKGSTDFTVEIKYNGEQWGPPYFGAGGRMAGWYSYSFEDYLSSSGEGGAKKIWPGNTIEGGGSWPKQPYKLAWQVRANGTHRIFPFYEPDWVRRTVQQMRIGTASGFTVEPLDAYYDKSTAVYRAKPAEGHGEWVHERDAFYLSLWGRLGYDPKTPDTVFDKILEETFGEKAGKQLAVSWKAGSRVVPTAFTAWSIGPDHRNHAPELEWGGDTNSFMHREPFDSHVFMTVSESIALKSLGGIDGRQSPFELIPEILAHAKKAREISSTPLESVRPDARNWFKELAITCRQDANLAEYYAARWAAAHYLGLGQANNDKESLAKAAGAMQKAVEAWRALSHGQDAEYYRPFSEKLRLRLDDFHWKKELPKVEEEAKNLAMLAGRVEPVDLYKITGRVSMRLPNLKVSTTKERVTMSIPAAGITKAYALVKPLPSTTFFHKEEMERQGDNFVHSFPRENWGHNVSAIVEIAGEQRRIPDWNKNTPYIIVPAMEGQTPMVYSSEETLAFLDPNILNPARYGSMIVATQAGNFFRWHENANKRKILEGVKRGMPLIILMNDYLSGRYSLDFLPSVPKVWAGNRDEWDPAGQFGLQKIKAPGIITQYFDYRSKGWEVFGNGALARMKLGEGEIWLCQARLVQNIHHPACAKALATLLRFNTSKDKPAILVDAGTENPERTSSIVPNLLNSQSIPFMVLGEVIAKEQGMNSAKPIPGKISDDDTLNGRGPTLMNDALVKKVKSAAAIPCPDSKEELLAQRAAKKKEVMRVLGLDPLPERTPLNARVTGIVYRDKYRIEKIVYESRPKCYVTAHLYIPNGMEGKKLPVIVNPHGHWRAKKLEPVVQSRLISQVLSGYIAFIPDSPGFSWDADSIIERREFGTHWTLKYTVGGANVTGLYVWDMMRGIDYLESRPECDMAKVGCTGASGGGLGSMWAFAADERIKCLISVCYPCSMEIAPFNGCECNHTPGCLNIGDRADVMGVRAPAPAMVIGAINDREFPPEATQLTGEKLKKIWGLFGKEEDTDWKIFPGGHDYGKAMREAAMGFFNKHLLGKGDGSPVPEPPLKLEAIDNMELFVFPDAKLPSDCVTIQDIALQNLKQAKPMPFSEVVALNGGLPEEVQLRYRSLEGSGEKQRVSFESEKGVTIPAILYLPKDKPKAGLVLISEEGKVSAKDQFGVEELVRKGYACLAVDVRGFGELTGLDARLMTYLGTNCSFTMGWDAMRASKVLRQFTDKVIVVGQGTAGAQAAMFAGLMNTSIDYVVGLGGMREYNEVFNENVSLFAVQPRAHLGAPLSHLRSLLKERSTWTFMNEPQPNLASLLDSRG